MSAPRQDAAPPASPPLGIICRECGCRDLRVVQTIRDTNRVRRRRVCRHCGTSQMTTECVIAAK